MRERNREGERERERERGQRGYIAHKKPANTILSKDGDDLAV